MKNLKLHTLLLGAMLLLSSVVCEAQTSKKAQKWFDSQEWLSGAEMSPAVSIDVEQFAAHYAAHPERWKIVFDFLATENLEELPLGKVVINDEVWYNVQEYTTRPAKDRAIRYEKHEKFIDVQCMISGRELHGAKHISQAGPVFTEYNAERDIAMYDATDAPFYIIPGGMFTIFFPDQIHTTNYGFGEKDEVRKIVFKVAF